MYHASFIPIKHSVISNGVCPTSDPEIYVDCSMWRINSYYIYKRVIPAAWCLHPMFLIYVVACRSCPNDVDDIGDCNSTKICKDSEVRTSWISSDFKIPCSNCLSPALLPTLHYLKIGYKCFKSMSAWRIWINLNSWYLFLWKFARLIISYFQILNQISIT